MYSYKISYECEGRLYHTNKTKCAHFTIIEKHNNNRFTAEIIPKAKIRIKKFRIIRPYSYNKNQTVFVNGYQSWTESREYRIDEKMDGFSFAKEMIVKSPFNSQSGMGRAGDYFFCRYPRKKGVFYGYSYGYIKEGAHIDLFASLSERCGYTIIRFDVNQSIAVIEKDFESVVFSSKTLLADFAVINGKYDEAFDKWFEMMGIQCPNQNRLCGYTTWYNYYKNINEKIVETDLKALSRISRKIDLFQIDDGYQQSTGDWLNVNSNKFPKGMKYLADKIHTAGMMAGLWLSPFAVAKDSFIYTEHRDWLVCDKNAEPYLAGANWGGFYALDFYNEAAAEYIKSVFNTILKTWGFDMVKLDFLYAACLVPIHNKSRGQIMCEAMDFIRDCVGDKMILGCGVPLMPAFGKVDFCRIGADVALQWKYDKFQIREDVSTPNTVACSIFRRGLNGRAFMNDPDVFLLRDNNIEMSLDQRKLLAQINSLFGSLLFVSDNILQYNEEQMNIFLDTIRNKKVEITDAQLCRNDVIKIEYLLNNEKQILKFNYKNGKLN